MVTSGASAYAVFVDVDAVPDDSPRCRYCRPKVTSSPTISEPDVVQHVSSLKLLGDCHKTSSNQSSHALPMKGISLSYLPVFVQACGGREQLVGHDTSWVRFF
jgi:hypothetical protein